MTFADAGWVEADEVNKEVNIQRFYSPPTPRLTKLGCSSEWNLYLYMCTFLPCTDRLTRMKPFSAKKRFYPGPRLTTRGQGELFDVAAPRGEARESRRRQLHQQWLYFGRAARNRGLYAPPRLKLSVDVLQNASQVCRRALQRVIGTAREPIPGGGIAPWRRIIAGSTPTTQRCVVGWPNATPNAST